jgi:hypothetical protein
MNLDRNKFSTDESKSNPMVMAIQYDDCPAGKICFFMAVGFGTVANQCEYFESKETEETATCSFKDSGGYSVEKT